MRQRAETINLRLEDEVGMVERLGNPDDDPELFIDHVDTTDDFDRADIVQALTFHGSLKGGVA